MTRCLIWPIGPFQSLHRPLPVKIITAKRNSEETLGHSIFINRKTNTWIILPKQLWQKGPRLGITLEKKPKADYDHPPLTSNTTFCL